MCEHSTAGRQLLPSLNVSIEYYSYGGIIPAPPDDHGWGASGDWFTFDEDTNIFAVSLYTVPEIGYLRESFNRTVANCNTNATVVWSCLLKMQKQWSIALKALILYLNWPSILQFEVSNAASLCGSHPVVAIPWISLGCGYRREFAPKVWESFDLSWNYDYIYSWQLGSELNAMIATTQPLQPFPDWRKVSDFVLKMMNFALM